MGYVHVTVIEVAYSCIFFQHWNSSQWNTIGTHWSSRHCKSSSRQNSRHWYSAT